MSNLKPKHAHEEFKCPECGKFYEDGERVICPGCRGMLTLGRAVAGMPGGMSLVKWGDGWQCVWTKPQIIASVGETAIAALRKMRDANKVACEEVA